MNKNNNARLSFALFGLIGSVSLAKQLRSTSTDDGFKLHKFDADSPAVCIDGTPGGFYFRQGTSSVWIIE